MHQVVEFDMHGQAFMDTDRDDLNQRQVLHHNAVAPFDGGFFLRFCALYRRGYRKRSSSGRRNRRDCHPSCSHFSLLFAFLRSSAIRFSPGGPLGHTGAFGL